MLKLAREREPEPGPIPELPPIVEAAPHREGTGQDDLLAAAGVIFRGAPEVVLQRGNILQGYARWTRDDHLILLTLGFSELGQLPDAWEESGRGFELLVRIKGATVPEWLFDALDGLLEHTFKVAAGTPIRLLPTLWCETRAVEGLEGVETVNGLVRVVEVGSTFTVDDGDPIPPVLRDDEHGRTQLIWRVEQDGISRDYSLCGDVVVIAGRPERCVSPRQAAQRFREVLEQALRSPARMQRLLRERRARRVLTAAPTSLEADFLRARDDEACANVYRDWLLEHGDPRGDLAAWEEAQATDELEFFWQHDAASVLGSWIDQLPVSDFIWTRGFVESVLITRSRSEESFPEQLRRILALPFLATVRGLRVEHPDRDEVDLIWSAIAQSAQAQQLTSLSLNEDGDYDSLDLSMTSAGDLGILWPSLPQLLQLRVRGSRGRLGKLEHARLRSLAIESSELTSERVGELSRAKLPSLKILELWTGPDCSAATVEPLFALRGLTSFGLTNCDATQDVVSELVRSPLFATLRTLSFAKGGLQDQDVELLTAHAGALRKLDRFDVSDNSFTPQAVRTLRKAIPSLVSDSQRSDEYQDEGERYVSVAE